MARTLTKGLYSKFKYELDGFQKLYKSLCAKLEPAEALSNAWKKFEEEIKEQGFFNLSGYPSIFGNVDLGGDIVKKGAFSKTTKEQADFPVFISHRQWEGDLPIGKTLDAHEDNKGLWVKMQIAYSNETEHLLSLIKNSVKLGMSFAYDIIQDEYDEKSGAHLLKELRLIEVTICPFGMNPLAMVEGFKSKFAEETAVKNLPGEIGHYVDNLRIALQKIIASESKKKSEEIDECLTDFHWRSTHWQAEVEQYKLFENTDFCKTAGNGLNSKQEKIIESDESEEKSVIFDETFTENERYMRPMNLITAFENTYYEILWDGYVQEEARRLMIANLDDFTKQFKVWIREAYKAGFFKIDTKYLLEKIKSTAQLIRRSSQSGEQPQKAMLEPDDKSTPAEPTADEARRAEKIRKSMEEAVNRLSRIADKL